MVERWLLRAMRCEVSSLFTFTDNSIVRYFDQARLRKVTDIVEGRRENVN